MRGAEEAEAHDAPEAIARRQRYELASQLLAGRSVLDCGCGRGDGAAVMADRASSVHGIELDRRLVAAAQANTHDAALTVERAEALAFLRQDPFDFDAITCFGVIEQQPDPRAMLEALAALCRQGRVLLASVPNGESFPQPDRLDLATFGYESALDAFGVFDGAVLIPQFLVTGSALAPDDPHGPLIRVLPEQRDERHAHHFVFCVGFDEPTVHRAARHLPHLSAPSPRRRFARARKSSRPTALARAPGPADPNSWQARRQRADRYILPWIEQTVPLAGKKVIEYGCGHGSVTCAVAARAAHVVGLDIDLASIGIAERVVASEGHENVVLERHPPDSILRALYDHGRDADVVLLYAVLEHLTDDERMAVLEAADHISQPNGHVVVCETPNRLMPVDYHTSQVPFFDALPPAIAQAYAEKSPRGRFRDAVAEATRFGPSAGALTLSRWGRGVSYHEFELAFADLHERIVSTGWDISPQERAILPEEVATSRTLARVRPDVSPAWSRYWLDLLISARPAKPQRPGLRPWIATTEDSEDVALTRWDTLRMTPNSVLVVRPPMPCSRILVMLDRSESDTAVSICGQPGDQHEVRVLAADGQRAADVRLQRATQRVCVSVEQPTHVVFVGYEPEG